MSRISFPHGFRWGAATAAYQIEGGAQGWRDDVALLRAMHTTSHRFSIAWPRIQPEGRGRADRDGDGFDAHRTGDLVLRGVAGALA